MSYKENFDKWKKSAQAEIKKFKQNIITDEELYNCMINHKSINMFVI